MTNFLFCLRAAFIFNDAICDRFCDELMTRLDAESDFDDPRQLNPRNIDMIRSLARIFDRTESYHAAHIRDTIRDNCDY